MHTAERRHAFWQRIKWLVARSGTTRAWTVEYCGLLMSVLNAEGQIHWQELGVILFFTKGKDKTIQTALNSTFQLVWDYVISSYCHYYRGDRVFVKDRVNLPPQLSVLLFDLMMSRDALRNRHLYWATQMTRAWPSVIVDRKLLIPK